MRDAASAPLTWRAFATRGVLAAGLAWACVPQVRAVDPNFRVYDDQFVLAPLTIVQFGYDAHGTALSSLTAQGFASGSALEAASSWSFAPAHGTVADTVGQSVPLTSQWTCNLPDPSSCGFGYAGNEILLVSDGVDSSNSVTRGASAFTYDETTGRLLLRASAGSEGTTNETRLCFDPSQGRPDFPIFEFPLVSAGKHYLDATATGTTWGTAPLSCAPYAHQGGPCGSSSGTDAALVSTGPVVQGLQGLTGHVVKAGTVTLPSGHVLDALLVESLASYDAYALLFGSQCGGLNTKVTTHQYVLTWVVPYYAQVVTLSSPSNTASLSAFTSADSTLITYGLLPPLSIQAVAETSSSMTVSWNPGSVTKNIDGYLVHWGTQPGAQVTPPHVSAMVPVGTTQYTITGLTPSTTYYVSVSSVRAYRDPKSGVSTLYHSIELPRSIGADTNGDGVRDTSYPPETSAATTSTACVKGDVYPDGTGDGTVDISDWMLARQKSLGLVGLNARDTTCGDLAPGSTACAPPAAASRWCIQGDSQLGVADVTHLRRLVAGTEILSCVGCLLGGGPGDMRAPGDIAPPDAPDGLVTVADVVRALRFAAGIETPDPEALLRADLAPSTVEGSLTVVGGDGQVTVADVVLLLRGAAGIAHLAWPARTMTVSSTDGLATHSGFVATVSAVPAWATLDSTTSQACAGLEEPDDAGSIWALSCADVASGAGGTPLATFRYRSPEPLDPTGLTLRFQAADPTLAPLSVTGQLAAP